MRKFTVLITTIIALSLLPLLAHAQTATATLRGTVEDGGGKTLPGATATLTNAASGLRRTFTTGNDGQYTFTFLEPGQYTLEIQAQGFKLLRQEGVGLAVGQNAELNLTLEPGNPTDTVTVTANETTLQLDTANSALGGVVQRTQIDDLPLNGRNVFQLAQLEVGVNSSPGSRSATPSLSAGGVGEISINGGRTLTNEIVIDGIPITNKADNLPSLRPSPEAIQEFRIVTNAYAAEYGRTGGGALNFSIRSGGSKLRGTLFEFLRNDALDATNFFANQTGSPKEKFRFNQFGGNVGGPMWLPRFGTGGDAMRKSDKLFFFFNYEGLRVRQARLR